MNDGILLSPAQYCDDSKPLCNSPSSPVQTPCSINGKLFDWTNPSWSSIQDTIYSFIRSNKWSYGSRMSHGTITAVTNNYVGTALAQNGMVLVSPFASTTGALIFDSNNNRLYTIGSFGGGSNFTGGVLLNDGRVFIIPRSSTSARIVDITNKTITTPNCVFPGNNAYISGCLIDNGQRIYLSAHLRTTAGIYDIKKDTLSTPAGSFTYDASSSLGSISGVILLPDGRVFCVPYYNTAAIYDPIKDSLFTSSLSLGWNNSLLTTRFFGGVLLPNGDEILLIPQGATAATIYNWRRDTARLATGTSTGNLGGQLLPNGEVYMNSSASAGAAQKVYNPYTDTMSTLKETISVANPCAGVHILPDGRLCLMPRNDSTVRTYGLKTLSNFDSNIYLSPFYNHR